MAIGYYLLLLAIDDAKIMVIVVCWRRPAGRVVAACKRQEVAGDFRPVRRALR